MVMLDNFEPTAAGAAAAALRAAFGEGRFIIEASGGITKESIANFMLPNIDVISMGALTQGYSFVDFSLKILKKK